MLEGARSLLMHAGFPAQYWPYAVEYFCLMCNVTRFSETQPSAWFIRFGTPFLLPLIPFGAKVRYRPAATDPHGNAKLDPMGVVGVFLGYVKDAGGKISGRAHVAALSEFRNLNFQTGNRHRELDQTFEHKPYVGWSETVVKYDPSQKGWDFPLKAAHE